MVLSKYELGKLIKNARKIKSGKIGTRYTQVMLAKDINKSQGYIGDIESGRTYPTFKVLSSIVEACEVSFSYFEKSKDIIAQNEAYNKFTCNTIHKVSYKIPNKIVNIKDALDTILSRPSLMLNGKILCDDSKIALANAIKLGLEYAEQIQKKEMD